MTRTIGVKQNSTGTKEKGAKRFGRIPLPSKPGRVLSGKKGKRGYDRKEEKKRLEDEQIELA